MFPKAAFSERFDPDVKRAVRDLGSHTQNCRGTLKATMSTAEYEHITSIGLEVLAGIFTLVRN